MAESFFGALTEMADRAKSIDQRVIINTILNKPEIKKFIIELNTKRQLFDKNVDSRGIKLSAIGGDYSDFTIEESKKKGRPKKDKSSINLFDTGDYYDSFKVLIGALTDDFVTIDSDPEKPDGNLEEDWGEFLEGVDDQSIEELIEVLPDELVALVLEKIL